jgi:LmbE family N-acetylglucosaminyl deacetylase
MSAMVIDKTSRVLVVAPHPDDETLATGGLLQQAVTAGAAVRIIFISRGENNPWAQRFFENRWHIGKEDCVRFGQLRQREAIAALGTLGIAPDDAVFLGFPDQGITQLLLNNDLKTVECLADEIRRWQPTLVAGPSSLDIHPDHSAMAVLLALTLDRLKHHCLPSQMEYLVHTRRKKPLTLEYASLPLTDKQQGIKRQAILCHTSQVKLQRRKLLARVKNHEDFLSVPNVPPSTCDYHPVRDVQHEDGNLQLKLSLKPHLGAFGPSCIYFVGWDGRQVSPMFATLPVIPPLPSKKWRRVKFRDCVTGSPLAVGSYRGSSRSGLLRLPLACVGRYCRLFAKLERRFGFFDEAGWRELPIAHEK